MAVTAETEVALAEKRIEARKMELHAQWVDFNQSVQYTVTRPWTLAAAAAAGLLTGATFGGRKRRAAPETRAPRNEAKGLLGSLIASAMPMLAKKGWAVVQQMMEEGGSQTNSRRDSDTGAPRADRRAASSRSSNGSGATAP